jgi:hypothetical protein
MSGVWQLASVTRDAGSGLSPMGPTRNALSATTGGAVILRSKQQDAAFQMPAATRGSTGAATRDEGQAAAYRAGSVPGSAARAAARQS